MIFVVASLLSLFATENYPPIFVVKGQDDVYNRHLSENEDVALSSPQIVELENGTTFELQTSKVSNYINGSNVTMYAFNDQIPGPIIKVKQGSSIFINFTNNINMDSAVHWHGLKLNNKYDGVPGLTQKPVPSGESFLYRLDFPNEGVYWYHSHFREDKQQDLGMYGVILVEPTSKNYFNPVDLEVPLTIDDILMMANGSIYPFNNNYETFSLMGRYGNVMLLNGKSDYNLDVDRGQIVRFYLADTANARPFNFTIQDHELKLVGGDSGKYEKESLLDSVILSPAEREIVEVLFDKPGIFKILNQTPEKAYQPGIVNVSEQLLTSTAHNNKSIANTFYTLRNNSDIISEISPYRERYLAAEPDYIIDLTVDLKPMAGMERMEVGPKEPKPIAGGDIEWDVSEAKLMMNQDSINDTVRWILKDNATGKENLDFGLRIKDGDFKKIRFYNDPNSAHPMQHPIHIHGLRFLVLSEDGRNNDNLVWKDTVLVPGGSTVDILLVADNPGKWQMHCHISEHMGAGMQTVVTVT